MKPECPYGAEKCPKVQDMEKVLDNLSEKIDTITRIMYIMCGIIAIQLGVLIL